MLRNKVMHKILAIIGVTLFAGISVVGVLALWLQYQASMDLQQKNSRTVSKVLINEICEFMVRDDPKAVLNLAKVAHDQFGLDLKIYHNDGTDGSSAGAAA